jgi:hypothetical protein
LAFSMAVICTTVAWFSGLVGPSRTISGVALLPCRSLQDRYRFQGDTNEEVQGRTTKKKLGRKGLRQGGYDLVEQGKDGQD